MGWDLMCDEIRKCDCGKGHIRYISKMDDWNRTKNTEYVDCKECYDKYLRCQNNSYACSDRMNHDHTQYIFVEDIKKCI